MKRQNLDLKRKESIIRYNEYWGSYEDMPDNVKDIIKFTYKKLSNESREEIKKLLKVKSL